MTDVLVLVDHTDGELKNTTAELLTAARAFGTPAAVVVGKPGTAESFAETLAKYGAGEIPVSYTHLTLPTIYSV